MSRLKVKLIEFIFILMLTATTFVQVDEAASVCGRVDKEFKRINKVDIDDNAKINIDDKAKGFVSDVNKARIARYYRSPLIIDNADDDTEYLDFEEDEEEEYNTKNSESPATLIEMPESEHPLLRKVKESETENVKSKTNSNSNSYALPDKFEYPELVQSLKNVYKEMFITSSLYVLNIASAVGIVLVNKFIYSYYKFPHGLVLTLYHFVLTSIGLQVLAGMKMFPIKPVSLIKVLPLSISFCSYVVLTNLSLQYNSGTFYQVTKNNSYNHLSFC